MAYIIWLFLFVFIPTCIMWIFNFPLLWKYRKTFVYTIFCALVISFLWDVYAIGTNIWFFPEGKNLGIFILTVPLEEYLFICGVTLMIASLTVVVKYKLVRE